jgi:DNA-binding transcriptional ArsR family regulator
MGEYPRARREGLFTREVGDELVVYDDRMKAAHCLSPDAMLVWRHCDGHSSVKDIAGRVELEQARVSQALDELSGAELIEEPKGISRRDLYRRAAKLGAAGAAAVSAPLIYSVAIPPLSAGASTTCGSCFQTFCVFSWDNTTCNGPPSNRDSCPACSGSSLCKCQNLDPCMPAGEGSFRTGVCA